MPETPKTTETGTIKSPTTGSSVKADESLKKEGVVTGDKTKPQTVPTVAKANPTSPTTSKAVEDQKKLEESKASEPIDKNISEFKGEILQGDSFMISFTKGDMNFQIPVPLQDRGDVVVMDNTFRIIDGILKTGNRKEVEEKYASFIKK